VTAATYHLELRTPNNPSQGTYSSSGSRRCSSSQSAMWVVSSCVSLRYAAIGDAYISDTHKETLTYALTAAHPLPPVITTPVISTP